MFYLRYSELVGEQGLTGHDYVHGAMRDMGDSKVKKTRSLSSKRLQPSGGGQDNDTNDSETEQTAYRQWLGHGSCSHLKGGQPRLGNQHKQILESFEFPAHYEGEQTTVPGTQSPAGIRERTSLQTCFCGAGREGWVGGGGRGGSCVLMSLGLSSAQSGPDDPQNPKCWAEKG